MTNWLSCLQLPEANPLSVSVTKSDFKIEQEYARLRELAGKRCGAIVQFVGLVRDFNEDADVRILELQHYEGMTESIIEDVCTEARSRWEIAEPLVIHRVGPLEPGDQIVLVSVASTHRDQAFSACEFIMDQLKTKATFWKRERRADNDNYRWLEMKETDRTRAKRWTK